MAHITLEQLKEYIGVTDEQLGLICSDRHLDKIADKISNYLQYAHALELKERKTVEIHTDICYSFLLKTQTILLTWKNDNIYTATYRRLVEAALELGEGHVANALCQFCKERSIDDPLSPNNSTDTMNGQSTTQPDDDCSIGMVNETPLLVPGDHHEGIN